MTTVLIAAGALITLGGAALVIKRLWRAARKVSRFIDAVLGKPAEFGRPSEPGVLERMVAHEDRLREIQHELHPNSGLSLRDAVDRTERALSDHIANCPPVQVNVNQPGGG